MTQPRSTYSATVSLPAWVRIARDHISIEVVVRPGSARSEVLRAEERGLVIAVAAAPERGKANEELLRLIAKLTGVSRSAVSILKGESARRKAVRIATVDPLSCAGRLIGA